MGLRTQALRSGYDAHGEKLRFLLVGGWNTVFAYGVFALLYWLLGPPLRSLTESPFAAAQWVGAHHYLVVQWAAWLAAVPQSTFAFKHLVFSDNVGGFFEQARRAYVVYVPLQLLSTVMLWFFAAVLRLHPLVGQMIAVCVNALLSYLGHKHFTFGLRPATPARQSPQDAA